MLGGRFGGQHYRGDDRRRPSTVADARFALIGLVVLGSMAVVGQKVGDGRFQFISRELAHVGVGAALVLSLTLGALCYMRWRVGGGAPTLWLSVAMGTLGVVVVGLGEIAPLAGLGREGMVWESLHRAGLLVTGVLLVQALRSPAVDTRLEVRWIVGVAASGVAVLAVVLQMSETLWGLAEPSRAWLEVGWLALASSFLVVGFLRRRPMLAGFGLVTLGIVLAEAGSGAWSPSRPLLMSLGLVMGLAGTGREVTEAFRSQSSRVLHSLVRVHSAEAQVEAQRAVQDEVAHQARSALLAIQGAIQTLEHHRDQLEDDQRADLEAAVEVEIGRLQGLIAPSPAEGSTRFALAEVLAPLVAVERLYGSQVSSLVPADLMVEADAAAFTEIVQNLLENARRHAPGSPVDVRAQRIGKRILLRVEDRGPGIDPSRSEEVFQRGVRGERSGGRGLGLFVARRLAEVLGARLWVEPRPGGGASFCLELSVASADRVGEDAVEELDQIGQAAQSDHLPTLGGLHRPHPGGSGVLGEADDDVGH